MKRKNNELKIETLYPLIGLCDSPEFKISNNLSLIKLPKEKYPDIFDYSFGINYELEGFETNYTILSKKEYKDQLIDVFNFMTILKLKSKAKGIWGEYEFLEDSLAFSDQSFPISNISGTMNSKISEKEVKEILDLHSKMPKNWDFTIDRYNVLSARQGTPDIWVDSCMILESILLADNDVGELKYRFSLIGSCVASIFDEKEKYKDIDVRKNLKKLYDVRSRLVHGNFPKKSFDYELWNFVKMFIKDLLLYLIKEYSFDRKKFYKDIEQKMFKAIENQNSLN